MKNRKMRLFIALIMCFSLLSVTVNVKADTTITSNQMGNNDGYNYSLWKDSGNTSMTLKSGGTFSCEWSDIGNALFRKGKTFDETKTHQQLGYISVDYDCNYQPSGNSYMCVYGWTTSPLVEYYIVESWGTWRPPGAVSKGTITVDGGTYDIYETTRTNQPSIKGTKTFQQYWSVRTTKRTSGSISVTQHFNEWEKLGLKMGKMYEVALTVEGYKSSGKADVISNKISIGGNAPTPTPTPTPTPIPTPTPTIAPTPTPVPSLNLKKECEKMTLGGKSSKKISKPFSGVALSGNNDFVKFTQKTTSGTHSFSVRGCSNNSSTARVDLKIGGKTKGTFYLKGSKPTVYTLNNIKLGSGKQEIQLVVTADTGKSDVYVDYLKIKMK